MKAASAEMIARIAQETFDATILLKITRKDGDVRGFTNYDRPVADPNGGLIYIPGYTRTAMPASEGLNVNRFEVTGWLDDSMLGVKDLRSGLYDDARVLITLVDPTDLTIGGITLAGAVFGQVEIDNPVGYKVEISSLSNRYQQQTGELYSPNCPARHGDARCTLTPLVYGGKVDSIITDRRKFTAEATGDAFPANDLLPVPNWQAKHGTYQYQSVMPTGGGLLRAEALTSGLTGGNEPNWPTDEFATIADNEVLWQMIKDDYFYKGRILWTVGLNAGFGGEIKAYNGTNTFEVYMSTEYAIQVDDEYTVEAGDDKKYSTCLYKFDNIVNFRGYAPWSRGERALVNAPDATKIK